MATEGDLFDAAPVVRDVELDNHIDGGAEQFVDVRSGQFTPGFGLLMIEKRELFECEIAAAGDVVYIAPDQPSDGINVVRHYAGRLELL